MRLQMAATVNSQMLAETGCCVIPAPYPETAGKVITCVEIFAAEAAPTLVVLQTNVGAAVSVNVLSRSIQTITRAKTPRIRMTYATTLDIKHQDFALPWSNNLLEFPDFIALERAIQSYELVTKCLAHRLTIIQCVHRFIEETMQTER